jgi:hypothetical protein
MLFRQCNIEQLQQALTVANVEYRGNLAIADDKPIGKSAYRARLVARKSREYGARTSASGRHGPFASWEAHRDFLRALFVVNPRAVVITSMARYTAENFESVFPPTGQKNIGSMMNPCTMPQCSVAMPPSARLQTVTVRTMRQSDLLKCPHCIMIPDHYRPDGSCKCNDPRETVMREWGYTWTGAAWA